MTDDDARCRRAGARLDAALLRLAVVLRGETARPDEHNCECHWGSAEELALLKTPDVALDPDLLRRSWQPSDWTDHGAVIRRVLPQLAEALTDRRSESYACRDEVGVSLARGHWQAWPPQQAAAVEEFLAAYWEDGLLAVGTAEDAAQTLALCAEASGGLVPWLDLWAALDHPAARRNLAAAAEAWADDLARTGELPWRTWQDDADGMAAVLAAWLADRAPGVSASGGTVS